MGVFIAELLHSFFVLIKSDHIFRLNFSNDVLIVINTDTSETFLCSRISIFRRAFAENFLDE